MMRNSAPGCSGKQSTEILYKGQLKGVSGSIAKDRGDLREPTISREDNAAM